MGRFSEELRRMMRERGLKQIDFQRAGVSPSSMYAMLHGRLPSDANTVRILADVLSVPAEHLLKALVMDKLEAFCRRYSIRPEDTLKAERADTAEVPVYSSVEEAVRGTHTSMSIKVPISMYREGMYAVRVGDNRLYPLVERGSTLVLHPGAEIQHTDIAVVGVGNQTGLYRVIRFKSSSYVLETLQPYRYTLLSQREIQYIARAVIIIRPFFLI